MFASLIAAAALAVSLQGQPAPTTGDKTPVNETAKKDDDADRMICRRTKVAGSNFTRRICATKAEWDLTAQRSRDTAREMQRDRGFEPNR